MLLFILPYKILNERSVWYRVSCIDKNWRVTVVRQFWYSYQFLWSSFRRSWKTLYPWPISLFTDLCIHRKGFYSQVSISSSYLWNLSLRLARCVAYQLFSAEIWVTYGSWTVYWNIKVVGRLLAWSTSLTHLGMSISVHVLQELFHVFGVPSAQLVW